MTPAPGDYEDLFQRAPFGYVATDIDGSILEVNDTLLEWLGRRRDVVAGSNFGELLDPGSRLFYETRYRSTLLLQDRVDEVALTLLRADGSTMPVLANASADRDAHGEPSGTRIALLDASSRHEYERALLDARRAAEGSEARSRVLQVSAAAFIAATTESELAQQLVASAIGAFDAATATVLIADDAGSLVTAAGTPRSPAPGGPVRRAFETRAPVVVESLEAAEREYPAFLDAMRAGRIDAISAIPLLDGHVPVGVLVCTYGRSREFDGTAIRLQSALALQATQVLVRLRLQAELQRMALHDPLTGLANRQLLHDRAEWARLAAVRSGSSMALVFFDLDGFKQINDRFGHQAGDGLLIEVAERLRRAVRSVDFCARFGGDEFVVVCEDADDGAAALIAERIRVAIAQPYAAVSETITASVGVAVVSGAGAADLSTDLLLERADAAMYASKNAGRDRVTIEVVA